MVFFKRPTRMNSKQSLISTNDGIRAKSSLFWLGLVLIRETHSMRLKQ